MLVFDDTYSSAFYPICLTRSIGDLRCGVLKLRQRLQNLFDDEESSVWIPSSLEDIYTERHPDWLVNKTIKPGTLCVNSRLKVSEDAVSAIRNLNPGECLLSQDQLIAFRPSTAINYLPELTLTSIGDLRAIETDLPLYGNLADIVHDNERMLRFDFDQLFYDKDNYFDTEPGVTALHPYNIWIGENVVLKPGVVLDASEGPIIIDEGVTVMPNAVILGPSYIGKKSIIKVAAKIYGATSIGPVCKVGGEVEGSIFQAYSNKQHDGFLGHSYLGEWVNIGADTNNSDLKNTYKDVSFYSYLHGKKISSKSMFLGALIGDHVKLGINTSLNTGCVIGTGSNLWGSDLIADFIPDFSWGTAAKLTTYRLSSFCETASLVKQRRGHNLSQAEIEIFKQIHPIKEELS